MFVMAFINITLHLLWLQMAILCEVRAEENKRLGTENVLQHCVLCMRYKLRLENELNKKHMI
jgi:predicted CoA-binding protein